MTAATTLYPSNLDSIKASTPTNPKRATSGLTTHAKLPPRSLEITPFPPPLGTWMVTPTWHSPFVRTVQAGSSATHI
jgi:hypothetical protein